MKLINLVLIVGALSSGLFADPFQASELVSENLVKIVSKKYPGIVRVFEHYDLARNEGILVFTHKDNARALVLISSKVRDAEVTVGGAKIFDNSKILIPETVNMIIPSEITADGFFIYEYKYELSIGFWFDKDHRNDVTVQASSSEGSFLIKWFRTSKYPLVEKIIDAPPAE